MTNPMDERPVMPESTLRRRAVVSVTAAVVVSVVAVATMLTRGGAAPVAPAATPASTAVTTTTTTTTRALEPLSRAELAEEFRRLYPDLALATSVQLVEWSSAVCSSARAGTSAAEMGNRVQPEVPNPQPALRLLIWFGCPEYLHLFSQ